MKSYTDDGPEAGVSFTQFTVIAAPKRKKRNPSC